MTSHPPSRNPVERERAPAAPADRGEQPGKRTNDERNDPASEAGARRGNDGRTKRVNPG